MGYNGNVESFSGNNIGAVSNCYVAVDISGTHTLGGLAARNQAESSISNCYAVGAVLSEESPMFIGGLVGYNRAYINASLWNIDTSGISIGVGLERGLADVTGMSKPDMQIQSTFAEEGWDFVDEIINGSEDVWSICEGTNYPRFVWQIPTGDYLCPDGVALEDFAFFAQHWLEGV